MRNLPVLALLLLMAVACGKKNNVAVPLPDYDGSERGEAVEVAGNKSSDRRDSNRPWANNIGRYDEVFNDSNYIQYAHAERMGIDPMYSLSDAYNTRRPLVRIESGKNYQVDKLTHSMPYLVPEAAALLDEIGEDFGEMLEQRGGDRENNRIIVTSVLRSPYSVRRLRRVNRNAVDSSTHMFGTTFDISWNNFHFPDSSRSEDPVVLKGILAEVLQKKRAEGRCLVKFEKKTPCFHITVSSGVK